MDMTQTNEPKRDANSSEAQAKPAGSARLQKHANSQAAYAKKMRRRKAHRARIRRSHANG